MITFEKIRALNDALPTIPLNRKNYVMVHSRVLAFRELCPEGSITTDIIHMDDAKVVMKTTICDEDGKVLGTGIASEKFDSSNITKTSAFEVCETSAIGRAIGTAVGIGIDSSFASAEEVANAIMQQDEDAVISETEQKIFIDYCERLGVDFKEIGKEVGAKSLKTMTKKQHGKALKMLLEIEKK